MFQASARARNAEPAAAAYADLFWVLWNYDLNSIHSIVNELWRSVLEELDSKYSKSLHWIMLQSLPLVSYKIHQQRKVVSIPEDFRIKTNKQKNTTTGQNLKRHRFTKLQEAAWLPLLKYTSHWGTTTKHTATRQLPSHSAPPPEDLLNQEATGRLRDEVLDNLSLSNAAPVASGRGWLTEADRNTSSMLPRSKRLHSSQYYSKRMREHSLDKGDV